MGTVIDETDAKKTPCTCYELKNGKVICSIEDVFGFLSNQQMKNYCYGTYIRPATPEMEQRLQEFAERSNQCSEKVKKEYEKGDRLIPFLDCINKGSDE